METNHSPHNNIEIDPLKSPRSTFSADDPHHLCLKLLENDVDRLINSLSFIPNKASRSTPNIPDTVKTYIEMVKSELESYESCSTKIGSNPDRDSVLINSVSRIGKLSRLLGEFSNIVPLLSHATVILQMAMAFMEDELQDLLERFVENVSTSSSSSNPTSPSEKTSKSKHFSSIHDVLYPHQRNISITTFEPESYLYDEDDLPTISDQTLAQIRVIVTSMVFAGYEIECLRVYISLRRSAIKSYMKRRGFQKLSIEDIMKMNWEQLESQIVRWNKVVRQTAEILLPHECNLCNNIFSNNSSISMRLMTKLARDITILFLDFAEAITMTKREADRLFKVLDIYESLAKLVTSIETTLQSKEIINELKLDIVAVMRRLGNTAVWMFSDLENSIKCDSPKNAVPNGEVHLMSRYTMNYLKYACNYKDSLEIVFQERHISEEAISRTMGEANYGQNNETMSSFTVKLLKILELLDENIDSKSKFYKDPSLGCIFLMNNGRYIQQKIKDSPEMNELVGSEASQNSSAKLRVCHKNYQRETWRKVLSCLSHDGLQLNGKVQKPILKERLKNFNQLLDEIHKTQSNWVVSDEQLQSELRVSVSSMLIPAYRSFLAKFGQYFTSGRQTEKYVKYQPEDIETTINDLFDGNPSHGTKMRK